MSYLSLPDANLYYETHGTTGPWVTMINGHTRSSSDFKLFSRKLVLAGYRCLLLDNRGSGQTKATGSFDIMRMVEDVCCLWGQEKINQSSVLGISMGGLIAQILAAQFQSVSALVLISTYCDKKFVLGDELPWGDGEAAVVAKLKNYFAPNFAETNPLLLQTMARQISKNIGLGNYIADADSQRAAMAEFNFSVLHLENIRCPTLVLHGDQDMIIRPESAKVIAARIPAAQLKIYPSAGHLLLAERAAELYQDVQEFLIKTKS
jgi:pimeloyl-ACP methyl ester carboxylesterase